MFMVVLLIVTKKEKQSKCPITDKWISKKCYFHTMNTVRHKRERRTNSCYNIHEPYAKCKPDIK